VGLFCSLLEWVYKEYIRCKRNFTGVREKSIGWLGKALQFIIIIAVVVGVDFFTSFYLFINHEAGDNT